MIKIEFDTRGRLLIEDKNLSMSTWPIERLSGNEYYVDINTIETFITVARDMNFFNKKSDVDFIKMIYDTFLNDAERQAFKHIITQTQTEANP
jgi:hypothetical protein